MATGRARSSTTLLTCPINKSAILAYDDAEPLPSMFRRSRPSRESKACCSNGKARISPYIVIFVLLVFAPAQAALLTARSPIKGEEAMEETLVLVKQAASGIAAYFTMSSAAKRDANPVADMD